MDDNMLADFLFTWPLHERCKIRAVEKIINESLPAGGLIHKPFPEPSTPFEIYQDYSHPLLQ